MNKIFDLKSKINYDLPDSLDLVVNSSLKGNIECSYGKLVEAFGEPNQEVGGDGSKVDAEWLLNTSAGIATIYNYKDGINYLGEEDGEKVENITDWHIGGHKQFVVDEIVNFLGLNEKEPKVSEEQEDNQEAE